MEGILWSICKPYTDYIKSGKKTIEVRKVIPKNLTPETPNFIYETKANGGCGKVIGEFKCDKIIPLFNVATDNWELLQGSAHVYEKQIVRNACLTEEEIHNYSNGKYLYGLHITELVIYDKPKELSEFKGRKLVWRGMNHIHDFVEMKYPPQSWCYVEV